MKWSIILSFIPPRLSFEVIYLSQIVYDFFVKTLFLSPCYWSSRISVYRSKLSHLTLKLVEKIILIWKRKNCVEIENGKIVLNWKTEKNRFETKTCFDISKRKKNLENGFLLDRRFEIWKTVCRRFKILKTVLKMFKTRFEKMGFVHPYS